MLLRSAGIDKVLFGICEDNGALSNPGPKS
jgi:hypothetical protein